jgi:cytochrome c biogenesis protein CcmG, thiol:disulfide interchange protein DsbE
MRAALAAIALACAACGGAGAAEPGSKIPVALVLPAVDGGEVELASYRGQVVVLHVFTTWSLAATGDVAQLAEADARDDTVVVGVATDPEGSTTVVPWRKALGVRYLVALADDAFRDGRTAVGKVVEVPATIVLDPSGVIARRIDRQLAQGELAAVIAEVISSRR